MNENNPEDKIILALDNLSASEAFVLLEECPRIKWIKIGLELFSREGPDVINIFKKMNKKIFLDLKFHDIPNTMKSACYQVSKLGVDMISLHSSAGLRALRLSKKATLEGAVDANKIPPLVIGITVLTSLSREEFNNELKMEMSISESVLHLANLSFKAGLNGCVCSPLEAKSLRKTFDKSFNLITPGIRLNKDTSDDQTRIMTPQKALENGSTKIVIGRSIIQSKDPYSTFLNICREIS
tara:strand:- start:1 stop:720 length:720 start_codon:yes stop_codon:yes gene_type:complete